MKIAVSANGNDLDASIDPRFGRCAFFLVVDPETMTFEAYDNENIALGGGAGIQSAQFVASKGVKAVITGNCGPNAVRTLSAAGIDVVMGQSGTVAQAVEAYKRGKLSAGTAAWEEGAAVAGSGPAVPLKIRCRDGIPARHPQARPTCRAAEPPSKRLRV
ncbi:MAG: NifB/NifX family molybdenum-iron cluster-binding protein [Deltaproteobacteria bacterium]|nr:NifB/NifX family molybdenum-iron cluster-binding protein [Deltaproteobacteria bacterium]